MARLSDLKPSITALSDKDAIELIVRRRQKRQEVKVKVKRVATPVTRVESYIDKMNEGDLTEFMRVLEASREEVG